MAGDWIKMRTNLDTNPHVIELAAMLGVPELHAIGMLWKVWSWADSHSIDGNAIRVTDVTLDRFTSLTGFSAALRKVGWLEGREGALSFPRFAEHNGQTAKNRAETAARVTKHRNAKSVTGVTQKALPEKRREEKSIKPSLSPFRPPSIDDVAAYCRERNNGIDAEAFVSFYQSKGWMIGKNKMKDWKAAIHTWEKKKAADNPPKASKVATDDDLRNYNPVDGGLG